MIEEKETKEDLRFISLCSDTTFKYLYKIKKQENGLIILLNKNLI